MSPRHKAYLLLLLVSAIWGFAPPIIKYAFTYFSPTLFLTYRFLLTILVLIPLLLVVEPNSWHILGRLTPREWFYLILNGLIGSTVQLGLLFWGLNLTTSLDASFISSVSPIIVTLAGFYILHEHITVRKRVGHLIAFFGTLLIVAQPLLGGQKLFSGNFLGNLLTLLGTVAWVVYVILTKRELRHRLSPLFLTTFMFFAGFISMSFITLVKYTPAVLRSQLAAAPLSAHASIIYMALISGALGYWAYQKAQKTVEISDANLFLYLSPLFTVPLSYFWLKEPITLPFILGAAVTTFGVAVSALKIHRS